MRRIDCGWGIEGATELSRTCNVLIIVDVLTFSTAVDIATRQGASIYPYGRRDAGLAAYAGSLGAEVAGRRGSGARYTLSAAELTTIAAGMRLVLPSPNGSMIAHAMSPSVCFAGCLRNAAAVAEASLTHGGDIGVIAAGERWPNGTLRPALEDFLGAGAFVAALSGRKAPDAMAAAAAFISLRDDLPGALRGGLSGQELIAPGYAGDVDLAAELDLSDAAPRLVDGAFCARECEPMAPPI